MKDRDGLRFCGGAMICCAAAVLTAVPPQAEPLGYDIAFASAGRLNVMPGDGSTPARVLREGSAILFPKGWSPDGRAIAYVGCQEPDRSLNSLLPLHFALCLTSADGTDQRQLFESPVEPFIEWSPDSQRLVFSSSYEDPERSSPRAQPQALLSAVYVIDVASRRTSRVTALGQNRFATWSPDGRRIAFSGDVESSGNRDIYLVEADGRNLKRVADLPTTDVQPAWSPGGDWIAFVAAPRPAERDREGGVFLMRPDGSELRRIWTLVSSVSWSPDGRSLLVRGSPYALIDVATGAGTELGQGLGDATFTSDGRSIVYRTVAPIQGDVGIYALDLQSGRRTRLTSGTSFSVSPTLRRR